MIRAAKLAVLAMVCNIAPAHAFIDTVPPFKGNDTGGIIAYSLYANGVDIKALAINHCAHYGKIVKLTGVQANYGSYISFACIWVHPGYSDKPLRAAY
jgi:hypothetical protein